MSRYRGLLIACFAMLLALGACASDDSESDGDGAGGTSADGSMSVPAGDLYLSGLPVPRGARPTGPPVEAEGAKVQAFIVEELDPAAAIAAYADQLDGWRVVAQPVQRPDGTWRATFATRAQGLTVVTNSAPGNPTAGTAPSLISVEVRAAAAG